MTMRLSKLIALMPLSLAALACTSLQAPAEPSVPTNDSLIPTSAALPAVESRSPLLSVTSLNEYYFSQTQVGNLRQKVRAAHASLVRQPGNLAAMKTLAYDALANSNPEGAHAFLKVALDRGYTLDDEALVIQGVAFFMQRQPARALDAMTKAEMANSGNALAAVNAGLYFYNKGNGLAALHHLRRAAAIDPTNQAYFLFAASACYLVKDFKGAIAFYERAMAVAPGNAVALYNSGIVYHTGLRDYAKARKQFETILASKGVSASLRAQAEGALANVSREEDGRKGMATIGIY